MLAYFVDYPDLCTGALVHPRILLTARHCLMGSDKPDYTDTDNLSELSIVGGADVRFDPPALAGVEDIAFHEDADIALVLLDTRLSSPTYCLRGGPSVEKGEQGIIVGYGRRLGNDPSSYGIQLFGETEVQDILQEEHIIEVGGSAASCNGDSGGPFFTKSKDRWSIAAVCSNGVIGCPLSGAYYTDIGPYVGWVDETALTWVG